MKRLSLAASLAACLLSLSCESLFDSRAWGNGPGRGAEARFRVTLEPGRNGAGKAAPSAKPSGAPAAKSDKPVASAVPVQAKAANGKAPAAPTKPGFPDGRGYEILARQCASGDEAGDQVIRAAIARIDAGTVLKGSCYDFVQACFVDAGFTGAGIKQVFLGKEKGPFADSSLIKKGDWVYFTHMYSATLGHSAIFVLWLDFEDRVALTIDYPGEYRAEPGRFRVADLYKVWGIHRAVAAKAGR